MKKFIFRLESLLKVRKVREDCVKRDLELAQQKWRQGKEEERSLMAQIDTLVEEMHLKRIKSQFDLQQTYSQILENLQASLNTIQMGLVTYQKGVELQKERMRQAIQARKVIEKIKEKHYTHWRTKESHMESSLADELGCHKHN